jgi:hypothetical protein
MSRRDYRNIGRVAQPLVVERRQARGSPPQYGGWKQVWGAKIDSITINYGAKPSVAAIWFPSCRWNERTLCKDDMVRIRTDHRSTASRSILFAGIVTNEHREFSGGNKRGGAFERNGVLCHDFRWLYAAVSTVFGQVARGPDDYEGFGTEEQVEKDDSYVWLTGRRTIFNENGRPNRDKTPLNLKIPNRAGSFAEVPIFSDSIFGEYWTAKQMLIHLMSPLYNGIYDYFPLGDPSAMQSIDHEDWDKVLCHIVVDSLNVIEAIELICKHIGWSFRQISSHTYPAYFEFFKINGASSYRRTYKDVTILHRLHAPERNRTVARAVRRGEKLLWSMCLEKDITGIINRPIGLGSPHRFEFTAELVPAWKDDDLEPDTDDDNEDLFKTEAELLEETDPNSHTYYKYYHARGSEFRDSAGRKWALNEAGKYTLGDYDRGEAFDFSKYIPEKYIKGKQLRGDGTSKRIYGLYRRQLLECLTLSTDETNSVGVIVEFSLDGGETWQVLPAMISSLPDEAGIYITEENLAEMIDGKKGTIPEGDLSGVELNYFTSICDDKVNSRSFKDGEWKTRVRVTASVQMDRRLAAASPRRPSSGTAFHTSAIYEFSGKYGIWKRTEKSKFYGNDEDALKAREVDSTEVILDHLSYLRYVNEDAAISGRFVLDRMWLGEGSGQPEFMIGDAIEKIEGQNFNLSSNIAGEKTYPEIVQITYFPDRQQMVLITRDLRLAEVNMY